MKFEFFVAFRYLIARRKHLMISIVTGIAVAGVAIGVMALIIVISVMTGFERDMKERMLGTNADIIVIRYDGRGIKNSVALIKRIEGIRGVIAAAPFVYSQVMASSSSNVVGVVLRGIDPDLEKRVTTINKHMLMGDIQGLENGKRGILLGKELARTLSVFPGDVVNIISPAGMMTPLGLAPRSDRFKVSGVFDTGMYEYDMNLVFVSLEQAQRITGMGHCITGISVKSKLLSNVNQVADRIKKALGFPFWVRTWIELNKNLFSALKLEKLAMFVILVLIVIVAAFNIISTLMMMVMEKHKDIGILKSMGASSKDILRIFFLEGIIIGAVGIIAGLILGVGISVVADRYHLIKLAGDVYMLKYLPFKIDVSDVIVICVSAMAITILATIYPAVQAAKLNPAEVVRYE